jgi:hypothetical protein
MRIGWRVVDAGLWAGVALGLLALVLLGAAADAKRVPLRDVPRPVLDAVRARFKDARMTGADRSVEHGRPVYEIAISHQGQSIDVTVTAEGAIVLIKRQIAARDLPEPVSRALEDRYPKATYKEVEEVVRVQGTHEQPTHYEVELVTAQRRTVEVMVGADGAFLKTER